MMPDGIQYTGMNRMHRLRTAGRGAVGHRAVGRVCIVAAFITACATTQETRVISEFDAQPQPARSDDDTGATAVKLDGSLAGYVRYAMKNSAELEAQYYSWQASVHRIAPSRALPNPEFSYAFYLSTVETRTGPQRQRFSVKQSFPWPSRLTAAADAASARANAEQRKFEALSIALQNEISQKYWMLWALDETAKIQQEQLVLLQSLSETASGMLEIGKIELGEKQQVDLALAQMEDAIAQTAEKRAQMAATLLGALGAPQSTSVDVTDTPLVEDVPANTDQLLEGVRSHPYIESFDAMARASAADAEKANTQRYPGFSVGLDWIETAKMDAAGVPNNGKDAVILGVGVQVPLWQRAYREGALASQSEQRQFESKRSAASIRSEAAFFETLSQLRNAARRIELYETTLIPQAEAVFESSIGTYTTAKDSMTSVLLAQQTLLALRTGQVEAKAAFAGAWSQLENLVGHPIETTQFNHSKADEP